MSEEKKKSIPIEDGSEKKEEMSEEAAQEAAEALAGEAETDADDAESAGAEGADESAEPEASSEEAESERYMRLMAEFQNFKKRAAKEKSDIHAFANERIINDLLPVLDNFERALGGSADGAEPDGGSKPEAAEMSEEFANYVKGMELIFLQLKAALEKAGLKEINALGEDFDPAYHNAVMTDQSDEYEDGKISKVMQKGYTLNGRVVRPSMVAVNKK